LSAPAAQHQSSILDAILATIFGSPQNATHKPLDPHEFASQVLGRHLQGRPGVKQVWLHRSLRTISGGAINSSKLPDAATVAEDGTITPYEILSPGQTPKKMIEKYAEIKVRPGFSVRLNPVKVLTIEEVCGLPEAPLVAAGISEGQITEGVIRTEQVLDELNDSVDDE